MEPHHNITLKVDGLVERVVQIVKHGLWKYGLLGRNHWDWDLLLPWIAMGYKFSKQASLASYIPYQLLYGREPILPSAIKERLDPMVNLDDLEVWRIPYMTMWNSSKGPCLWHWRI
jgi:hypothetical protein